MAPGTLSKAYTLTRVSSLHDPHGHETPYLAQTMTTSVYMTLTVAQDPTAGPVPAARSSQHLARKTQGRTHGAQMAVVKAPVLEIGQLV